MPYGAERRIVNQIVVNVANILVATGCGRRALAPGLVGSIRPSRRDERYVELTKHVRTWRNVMAKSRALLASQRH